MFNITTSHPHLISYNIRGTIHHILHAFHILHTLNRVLQPTIQPATKNMEKNTNSNTCLAQAMDPRSSEPQQDTTSSRFGETLSLERNASSLKTKALCLSESSSSNLGQFLLFLPRRDKLA